MASLLSGRFLPPVVASKFVIYLLIYLSVYLFNKFYLLVFFLPADLFLFYHFTLSNHLSIHLFHLGMYEPRRTSARTDNPGQKFKTDGGRHRRTYKTTSHDTLTQMDKSSDRWIGNIDRGLMLTACLFLSPSARLLIWLPACPPAYPCLFFFFFCFY